MTSARLPEVADFGPSPHSAAQPTSTQPPRQDAQRPVERLAAVQDRLASWLSDLTTLHELNDRLTRADSLDTTLHELLQAGAALVGAQRGVAVLEPADGRGPAVSVGLGLEHADLGTLETVPLAAAAYGRALDAEITGFAGAGTGDTAPGAVSGTGGVGTAGGTTAGPSAGEAATGCDGWSPELCHPDIAGDTTLPQRHRDVAARLGIAASYARQLTTQATGSLGSVVWMYDEPARPTERQRHLAGLYCAFASELVAKALRLARTEREVTTLREELLPARLPRVPGVRLGARLRTGPDGGGDWYDALALPEGALGLSVGGVSGGGPSAAAAMASLRASLRAYAVMEGEDPVAVLSDLELLLHVTEPARSATALFLYVEPEMRRVTLAGAGHCPPLVVGERRLEFVETSLSAPLGMLSCWEAPSVELTVEPGETLVLYTDGLLHRGGGTLDQAFVRLHTAAALAPPGAREDPGALCDHLLLTCVPDGAESAENDKAAAPNTAPNWEEDVAILAVRFD